MSKNSVKLTIDAFFNPEYKDIRFTMLGTSESVIQQLEKDDRTPVVRRLKLQKVTPDLVDRIISMFPDIEELDLSVNPLGYIPNEVTNLKHLRKLIMRNAKIETIPYTISKLESLQLLDLSFNRISYIQHDLFSYNNELMVLDLAGNRIASLNNCDMNNIIVLNLALNPLERLDFYALNLQELNLNQCSIDDFSKIHTCESLLSLNISSQNVRVNLETVTYLENLEYLNIAGNGLNINDGVMSTILKNYPNLKNIDISYNYITMTEGYYERIKILNNPEEYIGVIV